jgi:hypothetical protein
MANIFTLENIEDFSEKISIDELYEKKRQYDLNQMHLFNKLLNRIHVRIKTTSRQKMDEQFCWFIVPEIMIGVPKYDQAACIAYLIDKLKNNGFNVRYIHPNTLFISWMHWVPSYVRTELKNKTGIIVNEYGVKIEDLNNDQSNSNKLMYDYSQPNDLIINMKNPDALQQQKEKEKQSKKDYTPIKSYKPSGSLVYNDSLLSKLNDKLP